jgi:hypothetical protein
MAKTFYKYGERDAISYVDWSQVGKNFSTMIDTELTRREDEKAAIQKGVDETMAFINDNPIGDYDVANDFSLAHAKNAQDYLVMADKLLKSGQISPQDFVRMRENLNTGTKGIYEVADSYQKRYEEVMADVNSGDPKLSNLVYEQMISLEGIGKLKSTDAIIDTSSGRVNLSKYDVDEDGVKKYTEGYTTGELQAFLQSDIQRFDMAKASSDAAATLGGLTEQYLSEAYEAGGIDRLISKVNMQDSSKLKGVKEGYEKWLSGTVSSYMDRTNNASILVDFLQRDGYKPTTNKREYDEDKSGKLVYIAPNGNISLTSEQEGVVEDTLRTQINHAIKKKYETKYAGRKPYRTRTGGGTALDSGKVMNMMGLLYYGNQSQVKTATDYFRDVIPNATEVDRQKDKLIVTFTDGTSRDFDITGRTQKQFIESATPLLAGEIDLSDALSTARFDPNQTKSDFMSRSKVTAKLKSSDVARQYIGAALTDTPRERGELTRDINSLFGTLGFKATPIRFNQLTVKPPIGESVTFSNTDIQGIKDFLSTNIVDENADASLEYMKGYIEDADGVEVTEEVIDTSGY